MSVGFILPLPAPFQGQHGLAFAFERLSRVLLVSELDHRLILLEPFKTRYKGQICLTVSFHGCAAQTFVSLCTCGSATCALRRTLTRGQIALAEIEQQPI